MNKIITILVFLALQIGVFSNSAYALSDERARNSVQQDLVSPFLMSADDRTCIDGSEPNGKLKIDYWVDFECKYCRVNDIVQFQQQNQNMCIVIRHTPSLGQESMAKALTYEALLQQNANSANNFWQDVYPHGGISKPYTKPLLDALESIALPIDGFEKILDTVIPVVENDNNFSKDVITTTPTFVIENIRFPACDFNAEQLQKVIPLVQATRKGDTNAKEKIITIINNGLNNKLLL